MDFDVPQFVHKYCKLKCHYDSRFSSLKNSLISHKQPFNIHDVQNLTGAFVDNTTRVVVVVLWFAEQAHLCEVMIPCDFFEYKYFLCQLTQKKNGRKK